VDPYPGPPSQGVKKLPENFTFTRTRVIDFALSELHIPCGVPVFEALDRMIDLGPGSGRKNSHLPGIKPGSW
jgi:hypothetical protein